MTDHAEALSIAEEEIDAFCAALRAECRRYGRDDLPAVHLTDWRAGLEANHGAALVANAASGVVAALAELRAACGLPLLS